MTVYQPPRQEVGAGFEHPFDMLAACHERLERTLSLLDRLVSYLDAEGSDLHARDAARDVVRYFDIAAPAHHEDEERHVFPTLEASSDESLHKLAARLRADHQQMVEEWAALRPLLTRVMLGDEGPYIELALAASHFHDFHTAHMAAEDEFAFRPAHAVMSQGDAEAMREMGDEMARRRGLRRRRF